MKKIVITLAMGFLFVTQLTAGDTYTKVCKEYINQVKIFKKTMGNDEMSKKTLKFYQDKMMIHCGNLVAKSKFEKESFVELMMKDGITTTKECREAIEMASAYSKSKEQSALIVAAHKENIVDNCGSLVARKVSSYCLHEEAR